MPNTLAPIALTQPPERVKGCCQEVASPLAADEAEQLATVFRALADPTRVQMIHMLGAATEPVCVCDLTAAFDLGQPTISHHLAKLREAGIVAANRHGIWSFYSLNPSMPAATRAVIALIP